MTSISSDLKPKWKQTVSEGGNSALLFGDNTVVLFHETRPKPFAIINTFIDVNNVIISSRHFVAISKDTVQIYSLQNQQCQPLTEIPIESQSIASFEDTLYVAQNQNLLLLDMEGSVKLKVRLGQDEGDRFVLGSNAEVLVQLTDSNILKVMNIAQEPSNLHVLSINESMSSHLISNILSLNICVDGMVTSVLLDDETLLLISNREGKVKKIGSVKNHYFCQVEPRVFVYETVDDDVLLVHICFFDEDLNLYTFEEMRLDPLNSKSIGVTTPTITILHDLSSTDETSTNKISNNQMYRIQSRKMLGFEHCDMEDADNLTSTTMFYHQLSCGHLDKALALAKQINQKSLWKKLASQALRDRDTVVLKECSSPLGVEMKRMEMHDDLAIFGEIAVEIGMLEEAVNLYKDLDRKDLICDLFVSRRVWDRAFRAAEEDEVLKKSIHYYYGKYLEEKGDFEGASVQYGKSSLPERKLLLWRYERGILTTPQSLFEQIKNEENMSLPGLIAEYNGDLEEAERLFRASNDVANLIRLACGSKDNVEYKLETIPLQKESDFYQMGLVFEKQGDLPRAVEYLRKSGSLDHAIRIIKMLPEYIDLLVELALESKDALQKISCAEIIAKKGLFQKAARLFLDGGNVSKAKQIMKQLTDETLFQEDFSFQEKVEYVNLIDELDLDIPTKSVKACTKVLLKAKNEEKAIKFLLSKSLPLHNILSLLIENNVTLSKEKLNFLVKNSSDVDSIAQYLIQSKDFVGASELYSEKGDYVKGLKCLLKNDTPPAKIIEFASKSKSKEVFILAGNYLQTINYKDEPSIKKAIVTFYTKSESYLQLVSLFMVFSEEEALSSGDYQKTLKLLNEASKYSRLIETWDNLEDGSILVNKINSTTKFLEAKRLFSDENVEQGKKLCLELLESRIDPSPVQLGDIFASLIEQETDDQVSFNLVNQMIEKNIVVEDFLDNDFLEQIFKANGKVWGNQSLVDEKQSFETDEDALFHLSKEQRLILDHVCRKHWQEARDAILENKEELTVCLLNRICCECPPQSVLVEVMRSKAYLFKELDGNGRYPLHYLCKHGASTFTIIFAIQRNKDALKHKDGHGMTPVDYIKTSSWMHENIQDEKPMLVKELREAYNLSI